MTPLKRVRVVLTTDMGTHVEYVTPTMSHAAACIYAAELKEAGHQAEVIFAGAKLTARELLP